MALGSHLNEHALGALRLDMVLQELLGKDPLRLSEVGHAKTNAAELLLQGEGEVKILSRVLRPWADVSPDDEHAIMALDSDMVLMALMVPNPNVVVLSEPAR